MSRGTVVYGTCPRCNEEVPLRSDGTCCLHQRRLPGVTITSRGASLWENCPGTYHAPDTPHVHRCSCGVTFEETNQ